MNAKMKKGWHQEGLRCVVLGENVMVRQLWTPVVWEGEEDPSFVKTAALDFEESTKSIPNTGKAEICHAHKIGRVCPECIKEVLSGKRSAVA